MASERVVLVDIICAVYDGARYLPEFLSGLDAQTHTEWRLWVRDDGSSDDSVGIIRSNAATDPRVHLLLEDPPSRLGPARSFGRLLERLPADSAYIMCADQDDVWLPYKIEHTLAAMRTAERDVAAGPVLVHTDLVVADAELGVLHPSFWEFAGLNRGPAPTLRRIVVQNVTTGATVMINRALRELVGSAPTEAVLHDWWYACVAVAFGRIVAVREATVLYRQHGANAVGARDGRFPLQRLPGAILSRLTTSAQFRRGLEASAKQAGAFLERYGPQLTDDDRQFLRSYSALPTRGFMRRKLDLLRFRTFPEHGVLQTLGILFRG